MGDKYNNILKWTCSNWFIREDNLTQITNQDGCNIILNKTMSEIWTSMDYEITLRELIIKLKNKVDENIIISVIESFEKNSLIEIINHENQFDLIFG